jgi:hypothetical protein
VSRYDGWLDVGSSALLALAGPLGYRRHPRARKGSFV